jgi:fluoride exporter
MTQLKLLLVVFLGGGTGSIARFLLAKWLNGPHLLPAGTLLTNILACFILGALISLADLKLLLNPYTRIFLTVGFCGGFSTFSTFSQETMVLLNGNNIVTALSYIMLSVCLCLAASFGGMILVKNIYGQ